MHYILDGYNIIKSDPGGRFARGSLEQQRKNLIAFLNEARPQGSPHNQVTIVFDGPASVPYLTGTMSVYHVGDIAVFFSEGKSADERIEEIVQELPNAAETVVVTDDKGLRRLLGGTGVRYMGVAEFITRPRRGASRERPGEKPSDGQASEDIDEEFRRKWLK